MVNGHKSYRGTHWLYYAIVVTVILVRVNKCKLLHIDEFYSHSFVPDSLQITHHLRNHLSVDYNVTAFTSFPGKLLFSIFVRKLSSTPTEKSQTMLKYKNLDFCKTIELIKNYTLETMNPNFFMQTTFITSCPLSSGFFYIANGSMDDEVVPSYFDAGWYWVQLELVQVFDEVIKLINVKAKCLYEKSEEEEEE